MRGKTGKGMHSEPTEVNGSSALPYAQVKISVGEFKIDRNSLEDESSSGRPLNTIDEEMCSEVWYLVYCDRHFRWKR